MAKAFFIDLTRCTGCRGCQVACKQWKRLPAEHTTNTGSHQNPPDVSSVTYKTVHMREHGKGRDVQWLFFPEQCRHCTMAPCMTKSHVPGAIVQDKDTGAVIFTPLTAQLDGDKVRRACPYDIPRQDPVTKQLHKCDMCLDRVHEGMLPSCVLSCPTGAMSFGEEADMTALAEERLAVVRREHPHAVLGDAGTVLTIYLFAQNPRDYHAHASFFSDNTTVPTLTRRELFATLNHPLA